VFNQAFSQYIDGGSHTFNVSSNGKFTAVMLIKFTGAPRSDERIFDFGNGAVDDNIMLWRSGTSNLFALGFWNEGNTCQLLSGNVFASNVWTVVVATYTAESRVIELNIAGSTVSKVCSNPITNKVLSSTFVGPSWWNPGFYMQAQLAGLYAVDQLLSEAEIAKITSKMKQGEDTLQSCETCQGSTTSLEGSTSESDCVCSAGSYKSVNEIDSRALSLVPGQAKLSTLAKRDLVLGTNTAVFDLLAGPPGSNGAVSFDRASSQYIDGGAHTFNIASNGGFTAVAVVKFTGVPGAWEKIFDFGTGPLNDNIYLGRVGTSEKVIISMRNADVQCGISSVDSFIVQNTWMNFVVQYTSSSRLLELKIGEIILSVTCGVPIIDRVVSKTLIGMSNWPNDPSSLQGSIAGLYAVDAALSDSEIAKITNRMDMTPPDVCHDSSTGVT